MSRRKPCRLFAHFNQAPFFFLSVLKTFLKLFFSNYRYSIDGSSSRARSIACGSSSWSFQSGWSRTSRRLLANSLHRLLLSHFSQLLARPQCLSQRLLCVSGVRWMFFPPVAMRMVGLPLPPCGGPFVTFTISHCHF